MIIDSHTHFGSYMGMLMFELSVEDYLKNMERTGCDYMVQSLYTGIFRDVNEEYHELYGKTCKELNDASGGKIKSYFVFDPRVEAIDLATIEKYADDPTFVAIKIHPSDHGVSADDERYREIWKVASQLNLPIMSHTWALTSNPKQKFSTPDKFVKFLEEFPEVPFIFGHSGGRLAGIIDAIEIGKTHKNAYYDMAGDVYNRHFVEYVTENVGADRLLAASDLNWFDFSVQIGMVLGADITTEEKELILGGNAARLFNIK